MPATDNEIKEKYLERAIRELNQLSRDLKTCEACSRTKVMPVLGSGHPQADIFLLKYAPTVAEIEEGVAFYGRPGNALMKSFKRLGIDPTVVYGTICAKCPAEDPADADSECIGRVADEFNIVKPRIIVVMGEQAAQTINELKIPRSTSASSAASCLWPKACPPHIWLRLESRGPGVHQGAAVRASSVIGSTLADARPRTTTTSSAE